MDFYPARVEIDKVVYKRARMMKADGTFPEPRDYIGKYIYLIEPESVDGQRHMAKVKSVNERGMYITFIFDEPIVVGDSNRLRVTSWYESGAVPFAYENVTLETTMEKRAQNQSVRNLVERRMGIASEPGSGPANLIRAYSGLRAPRGAEGASSYGTYKKFPRQNGPWDRRILKQKTRGMDRALQSLQENYFGGRRTRRLRRRD